MKINMPVEITTRVLITDVGANEVILDKSNAIHTQNMARVIARGLSRESNHFIKSIAFGNGASFTSSSGEIVVNSPNVNNSFEDRLYNETYREIVDDLDVLVGTDPGSAESGNIRPGGGASPDGDPVSGTVTSMEVGNKSNITVSMYLNENEPTGQLSSQLGTGVEIEDDEKCFYFDEIGLYSPGKPATSTNGYSCVEVANETSEGASLLVASTAYNLSIEVDGTTYSCVVTTPASGSGLSGELTYGDICEGINGGTWITSGDDISQYVYAYITDRSGGTYPTILAKQSFGYLIFESKTVGDGSTVVLNCSTGVGTEFFNALTNDACECVNVNTYDGETAGVANDYNDQTNERERLLSHLTFSPILKTSDRTLRIDYIITVSVNETEDSEVELIS